MLVAFMASLAAMAPPSGEQVGYESLIEGRDAAAVEELRTNTELDAEDPVRLINLGIAYARQGREAEARAMFEAALRSKDRAVLETADGEWKDSRRLAYHAIKMLDRKEFSAERVAAR